MLPDSQRPGQKETSRLPGDPCWPRVAAFSEAITGLRGIFNTGPNRLGIGYHHGQWRMRLGYIDSAGKNRKYDFGR